MATGTPNTNLPIAERSEIHKSSKALENVVALFYDYCQVANAMSSIHKRLAKALKEAAATKATTQIPGNALLSSASIFEALAEVDTKFVKIIEREYDTVSIELKKAFKKMVKEEKAHDDRASHANARIKQAGQAYEKKAKKKEWDAADEHARYTNLLSTLGADMMQATKNHLVEMNQRHGATLLSVGACLSRVADAEWGRSCEEVRRCAQGIGRVGEWRAMCEGGWSGSVPGDLPDIERERARAREEAESQQQQRTISAESIAKVMLPPQQVFIPPVNSPTQENSSAPASAPPSTTTSSTTPAATSNSTTTTSATSTTATSPKAPPSPFDSPPNTTGRNASSNTVSSTPRTVSTTSSSASNTQTEKPRPGQPSESLPPMPMPVARTSTPPPPTDKKTQATSTPLAAPPTTQESLPNPSSPHPSTPFPNLPQLDRTDTMEGRDFASTATTALSQVSSAQTGPSTSLSKPSEHPEPPSIATSRLPPILDEQLTGADIWGDTRSHPPSLPTEFGERKLNGGAETNERANPSYRSNSITPRPESRDVVRRSSIDSTGSSTSRVAAMRDRYDTPLKTSTSPPARDVPRLSQTVTDIASRYAPADVPRSTSFSPTGSRPPSAYTSPAQERTPHTNRSYTSGDRDRQSERNVANGQEQRLSISGRSSRDNLSSRARTNDVPWEDPREREFAQRELELERRQRELDLERARFFGSSTGNLAGIGVPDRGLMADRRSSTPVSQRPGAPPSLEDDPSYFPTYTSSSRPNSQAGHVSSSRPQMNHGMPPNAASPRTYSQPTTNNNTLPANHLRRSEPPSASNEKSKEREKGTWMGRGLRRLSMPFNVAFSGSSTDLSRSPHHDEDVSRNSYENLPRNEVQNGRR